MIRILIVDDHPLLRRGLRGLIDRQEDMEVVAEAGAVDEAVRKALKTEPDVALVDLMIPGGGGLRLMETLHRDQPSILLIALTMHDDLSHLRAAMAAGASGYVVKRARAGEVLIAIRTVVDGRSFIDVTLSSAAARGFEQPRAVLAAADDVDPLSEREKEVLVLVAKGHTNREIGERVGISAKTVATYRARIGDKLGLGSRIDYVRFAAEHGLMVFEGKGDRAAEP